MSLHIQWISRSHLVNINSLVVEKSLLLITTHPLQVYKGSETFSGTEDKRLNIVNIRCWIALIIQEIPRVLWALCQKWGWTPNICFSYKSQILQTWSRKWGWEKTERKGRRKKQERTKERKNSNNTEEAQALLYTVKSAFLHIRPSITLFCTFQVIPICSYL